MLKLKLKVKKSDLDFCFRGNDKKGWNDARLILAAMIGIYFVSLFGFFNKAFALDLDKAKALFISGDYKAAISEGEKIMAKTSSNSLGLDELYYILGLSYLKDGNYLRASDIFEIILKEFKDTQFSADATAGLADAYFLKGDYDRAENIYKELLNQKQNSKLKPLLYCRLSQCSAKLGDAQGAKDYLNKLKQEFPLSLETAQGAVGITEDSFYYSVQVGSFSSSVNANNLKQELAAKGYLAFVEEASSGNRTTYRVKAGKVHLRQEAAELEKKLSGEGYPTKISP